MLLTIIQQLASQQFGRFCDSLYLALSEAFESVGKVQHQLAHEHALTAFHWLKIQSLLLIWKELCN